MLRELTASQLFAIATRSDTGSHNRLDLIQSLVPPHYVCNGYIYIYYSHSCYQYEFIVEAQCWGPARACLP